RGAIVRAAVGIAVSVVAIVIVFHSVDPRQAVDIVTRASPGWLLLAAVFLVADLVVRAARWRVLLAPIRIVPLPATLSYLLIGYLANDVLPARLGELVRTHYMGDRQGLSRATLLGFAAAGQAVGIQLTIGQASLLASGVALASAIPAGPASLGTFELAAVRIGQALGVASASAFAIGLLVHGAILIITSAGGV